MLEETLNHLKNLKLNIYLEENIKDLCTEILVDAEHLESSGAFKTDHLGYITITFDNTSNYIFHLWTIQKYKDVMEFIDFFVCDKDAIKTEELIN